MSFFDDKRNRMLLAGFLTFSALLELMFFGYAFEGLDSPLYFVLADLSVIAAIQPLICFQSAAGRVGNVFIGLGCLICSVFPAMYITWIGLEIAEGIVALASGAFWLRVLRYAVLCFGTVFAGGRLMKKEKLNRAVPALAALLSFACALAGGGGAAYSVFLAACAALAWYICTKTKGDDIRLRAPFVILLVLCFICCCVLLFMYSDSRLLTEEAACGFDLLLIIAGIVMAVLGYRYGLYVCTLVPLRLCLAYAAGWFRGDIDAGYLFGIIPFGLMSVCAMLCLRKGGRKETAADKKKAEIKKDNARTYKIGGKNKYDS